MNVEPVQDAASPSRHRLAVAVAVLAACVVSSRSPAPGVPTTRPRCAPRSRRPTVATTMTTPPTSAPAGGGAEVAAGVTTSTSPTAAGTATADVPPPPATTTAVTTATRDAAAAADPAGGGRPAGATPSASRSAAGRAGTVVDVRPHRRRVSRHRCRLRGRHVGHRPRRLLPDAHRPRHRPRLPARLPARRRPPPVAVPGHLPRPQRQRHPPRPGVVRPQHGDGAGRRVLHAAPPGNGAGAGVVRARHRRADAGRGGSGRSAARRSTASCRCSGPRWPRRADPPPPDGLGWVPVRTWLATYDTTTLARLDFRAGARVGRRPDLRLRRGERRRAHVPVRQLVRPEPRPPGRLPRLPVLGDRDVPGPGAARSARRARPSSARRPAGAPTRAPPCRSSSRYHAENPMQPRFLDGHWVAVDQGRRLLGRRAGDRRRRRRRGARGRRSPAVRCSRAAAIR